MNPSITLGRIAGVRVGLNWSWLIVFALVAWTLAAGVFPSQNPGLSHAAYIGMALVATVLFFCSLLLHELGHALQARREGVPVEEITLWLFGGVARFRGMFPSAGAELRIALAGPLVSFVLGGLFVAAALAGGLGTAVDGTAAWLGYINLLLLVFNLLPAFPLDGGRVLRALLWRRSRDLGRATRIATDIGRAFGYFLIAVGAFMFIFQGLWTGVWFAFLGWFLLQAAAGEAQHVLLRAALGDLRVGDVMVREPVSVGRDASLNDFVASVASERHFTTYPVRDDGRVLGLLPFASIARVPREEWDATPVVECMVPLEQLPRVQDDELLLDAVAELESGASARTLVWHGDRIVGLLSITDVGRLVAAAQPRRARS